MLRMEVKFKKAEIAASAVYIEALLMCPWSFSAGFKVS